MRAIHRIAMLAVLVAIAPVLAGCEDFDMDKFDFLGLNNKKPLPGKRDDLFPTGVPGVTQGIPPEYMKGYQEKQQAAEAAAATQAAADKTAAGTADKKTAAAASAVKPQAKPKPKKRIVKRTPKPAGNVTVQPVQNQPVQQAPWPNSSQQQQPQQSNQAPWPAQGQQPQQQTAPWPSSPPSGTFSH